MTDAPVLCMVTDRRRAAESGSAAPLVDRVRWAADAGVDLVQLRERDLEGGALADLAGALVGALTGSRTRLVVNERVDVALAVGAAGVHLRGDSMPASAVRTIAPAPFVIGRSIHGVDEARNADADYLIAGTSFATASKGGEVALLGVDGLRAIVAAADRPVLAIGGMTRDRVAAAAQAGAAGIAAIGLFLDPDGPAALRLLVADLRREYARGASLRVGG